MPFLLRWWSKPLPKPSSPSTDRSSSSEIEHRLHISTPTKPRRSVDRARNVHHTPKTPGTFPPKTHTTGNTTKLSHEELLNEKCSTSSHHLEQPARPTDEPANLLRSNTNVHKSPAKEDLKPSLIRRVTSKLRITIPATTSSSQPVPSAARHSVDGAKHSRPPPRATLHHSSTLPNSFVSRELREAALRERGLRPPRKDLSEQEREADQRLASTPLPASEQGESSAASKIKEEWLLMNRSTESKASDSSLAFSPPQLNFSALASGEVPLSYLASNSPPRSSICDSDSTRVDSKAEDPLIGRPSISSTLPPLSPSSPLEALQEESAEHVPPTPLSLHAQPPIIISTPAEDALLPNPPVLIESPVSCAFLSHLAPPESLSQPHIHSQAPSNQENSCSQFPAPPARRRMTNSSNRSHSSGGTSLSKFGTNSFTNLRRSVIGSIRHSGSNADISTSSSQPLSPRLSVRPTIHSRESIMFEAKGITDDESRRLSELAFLD